MTSSETLAATQPLVLEVDGVTKRYGHNTVPNDLSFTVEPGRVTGFLGPNGSGKSTTIGCAIGSNRPEMNGKSP